MQPLPVLRATRSGRRREARTAAVRRACRPGWHPPGGDRAPAAPQPAEWSADIRPSARAPGAKPGARAPWVPPQLSIPERPGLFEPALPSRPALPPQPALQLPQPFRGGRPLFIARLAGAGVRQLLRNFGKVDLEVVNKDIVHGVLSSDFELSKSGQKLLSRAVRRMFVERLTVYKDVTGAKAIMAESRPPLGPVIFIDC